MAKFIQYMTRESLYDGPFDSKSGWPAAGMGDVIVTDGGRLIVIDGGLPNDSEELTRLLLEKSNGSVANIDLWIITHPHPDHYGAIREICKKPELKNAISVKQFLYWFPDDFCNRNGEPYLLSGANSEMDEICKALKSSYRKPSRNETIILDDVKIKFLFVPDDCSIFRSAGENSNMCSLIFTVEGKDKKVMVTGDAYRRSMQITSWRYADELKCDILQMPHHALCDAFCVDFYKYTEPEILLLPISAGAYRSMHSKLYDKLEGCIANLCLEAKAKEVHKAFEGTAEISI